jgi:predicted phosphodiesterase
MSGNNKTQIVKDAVRRFHHLPDRTIARYILQEHGDLFNNDLEGIRGKVRYWTGKDGKNSRDRASDKSLFKDLPSKIPQTWRKTRTKYKLNPGLWAVFSDIHAPFHEPIPIEVAVSYAQSQKVNGVFFNGDFQDCASVSYWPKAKRDFNKEIGVVIDLLDWFRSEFPNQEFVYKPGNHEYALPRYYMAKAPELAGTPLAAMETVIGFEERNIEFLDYHQVVMAGKLPIIHGHEVSRIDRSVNPARGLFLRAKTFAACSHCHTTSEHTPRNLVGELLTTWSFGCLCDLSPDFNPLGNDWNWGFSLIYVEKDGSFEVENRRILPSGKLV